VRRSNILLRQLTLQRSDLLLEDAHKLKTLPPVLFGREGLSAMRIDRGAIEQFTLG